MNLFLTRQLGPDQTSHGLDFNFAWQSRWNLWAPLSPAIEIYGYTGTLGSKRSAGATLRIPGEVGSAVVLEKGRQDAGRGVGI